jgi:hypothetical protein
VRFLCWLWGHTEDENESRYSQRVGGGWFKTVFMCKHCGKRIEKYNNYGG